MNPQPAFSANMDERVRLLRNEAGDLRRALGAADLGSSFPPPQAAWAPGVIPPDFLPGYTFVREIHRGGQGVVYEATQLATRRRVAIKLLHTIGSNSRAFRRFEREAELITQLRHPNVVTVFDAGQVEIVSYLIMEYVAGRPIDVYVADTGPGLKSLLRLFAAVCDGVNAAHLKGIIHRDLKPGNILIDADGQPRVLDFGLAKLTVDSADISVEGNRFEESDAGETRTSDGQFIGSLPWASPEQAAGRHVDIDLRTDVYSLGVVLYQLLTGRFPYDVTGPMREVLNRIVTAEPARPGAAATSDTPVGRRPIFRLSFVPSWLRGSVPSSAIDSDVETIVLKCLSKDPAHRYQSAGELGADIRRYLSGEPVNARPPTALYRARKFVRRYRVVAAAAAAVVIALVVGSTLAIVGMLHAQDEAERATTAAHEAQRQADRATKLQNFYQESIQGVLDPWNQSRAGLPAGRNVTVEDLLHHQEHLAGERFLEQAELESNVRLVLSAAYFSVGDASRCLENARLADELARRDGAPDHARVNARHIFAFYAHQLGGDSHDVVALGRENYADAKRVFGANHPQTLEIGLKLVWYLRAAYRLNDAEQLLAEIESLVDPSNTANTVELMRRRSELLGDAGRFRDAEVMARRLIEFTREQYGKTNVIVGVAHELLGIHLAEQGRACEAVAVLRVGQSICEITNGPDHPFALRQALRICDGLAMYDPNAAEALLQPAWEKLQKQIAGQVPGEDISCRVAQILCTLNRYSQAEQLLRPYFAAPQPAHMFRPKWKRHLVLGQALFGQGRWTEAETLLREGLSNLESAGAEYYAAARLRALLGKCLLEQRRYPEAEAELIRAFTRESRNQGADPGRLSDTAEALIDLYARWETSEPDQGHAAKAQSWRDKLTQFGEQKLQSIPEH